MKVFANPAELAAQVGKPLGYSAFRPVDQGMIDAFAEVTGDRQWIHVDVARAGAGPYGSPIAHGMLTLSMAVDMLAEVFVVDSVDLVVNKGFDRVRFGGPVPSGARVRLSAELLEARPRPREFTEAVVRLTMEIDGAGQPAYTADLRLLYHCGSHQ
jgi:acyl dehydratase